MWRRTLIVLVVLVACLPASGIVTLLLIPLWRWIEATYNIESIGHSGPAEWCFAVLYAICVVLIFGAVWRYKRRTVHRKG